MLLFFSISKKRSTYFFLKQTESIYINFFSLFYTIVSCSVFPFFVLSFILFHYSILLSCPYFWFFSLYVILIIHFPSLCFATYLPFLFLYLSPPSLSLFISFSSFFFSSLLFFLLSFSFSPLIIFSPLLFFLLFLLAFLFFYFDFLSFLSSFPSSSLQ